MTLDKTKTSANDDVTKAKRESELEAKLTEAEKLTLNKENLLTQLLAKNGVRDVLKAEQEGRSVAIIDAEELARLKSGKEPVVEEVKAPAIDDSMSNQELASSILSSVSDLVSKKLDEKMSTVTPELDKVRLDRENRQKKEVEEQINACRQSHPDEFDNLQKPMYETWDRLMTKGPQVEDIFILAKAHNADPIDEKAETEKPNGPSTSGNAGPTKSDKRVLPGSHGFKQMLQEHMDSRD